MSQLRGNSGTLIIVVSRAKDLPNKRKLEKQNPYCLLRLANLTDKTKADLRGGQVPRWYEEFRFHISPEAPPVLKISVLDETKKAPTLIAEADIDFTPVFYASVADGFDKWHNLKSGDGRDAGEIYLEMTFYPSTGGTTFSASGRKMASSYGSSFGSSGGSSMSASSRKRQLPPIPGEKSSEPIVIEDDNGIPPPLPRATPRDPSLTAPYQSFSDSMGASQTSVHSLPDIPLSHPEPHSHIPTQSSSFVREPQTPDLMTSEERAQDARISSSNAFDELEREVQLNYKGPTTRTTTHSKPKPPPVPSHSSGSLKSSSSPYTSLAPPRSPQKELPSSVYNIIEPKQISTSPGRRSPTRKPPSNFYRSGSTSPARTDLSSIPYDANTISSPHSSPSRSRFPERVSTLDDKNVLLEKHNAPYDRNVNNASRSIGSASSMGSSGGRSRMSPSRFKSSLPPPPPLR